VLDLQPGASRTGLFLAIRGILWHLPIPGIYPTGIE